MIGDEEDDTYTLGRMHYMNNIHTTAIIGKNVTMGDNNCIGPYVTIYDGVEIGDDNRFEGHCSVGAPAEHQRYFVPDDAERRVVIGNNNVIREFVTINAPTTGETRMGNNCIMLRGSHLSHDSVLEDHVTVSCNVLIGGHSHIMQHANLGLGCILHQFTVVGSCAMVGMGAVVTKKLSVMPGGVYVGNPAKRIKENMVGIKRSGYEPNYIFMDETARYLGIKKAVTT